MISRSPRLRLGVALLASLPLARIHAAQPPALPSAPLTFGAFTATFSPNGTFAIEGQGWPAFRGTYKKDTTQGSAIELVTPDAAGGCDKPARYAYTVDGGHVTFDLIADDCVPRRMILDRSAWRPSSEPVRIPERRIVRSAAPRLAALPAASPTTGSWPSFRGPQASGVADGQGLPDRWDAGKGQNILWRAAIPGLAH